MDKMMYRVYRRDTLDYGDTKWKLRASFVDKDDAVAHARLKQPCDITIEFKIMKGSRNIWKSTTDLQH